MIDSYLVTDAKHTLQFDLHFKDKGHQNSCYVFRGKFKLEHAMNTQTSWKQSLIALFAVVVKGSLFKPRIMISPQMTYDVMQMRGTGMCHICRFGNWHKLDQ